MAVERVRVQDRDDVVVAAARLARAIRSGDGDEVTRCQHQLRRMHADRRFARRLHDLEHREGAC